MNTAIYFAPVCAQSLNPVRLAMQRLWLGGRLLPAGARLTIQHIFRSQEEQPLEVIYSFPLPRDAALRSFRISGENFEAHSELKPVEEAVREYERGIADGSLATLARQYGDGLINLTVGNVRPGETVTVLLELAAGVELRDRGFRFRFPFTLAPAYHPRMRTARTLDGEGEIELPAAEFGDVILPPWRADAAGLHEVGFELEVAQDSGIEEIGSPSHAVRVKHGADATTRVALAPERDVPDRDLVLDIAWKESTPRVLAGGLETGRRAFAAIVPSTAFGPAETAPRRTVILLDRSGSMGGSPIRQARKAVEACLAALAEEDMFGLVAFDDHIDTLDARLLPATRENRARAVAFLGQIDARGGTELAKGFEHAAQILAGPGDVLILTDGQVAGTEQILARARQLACRLSCLGIGSASQDRFLALLARETAGISRFVTADERVDIAALDLFASLGRPVAGGLKVTGEIAPEPPATVFAGTPVLLFGEAAAHTDIELAWEGGRLSLSIPEGGAGLGHTIRLLQGARLITDWESRYPAKEALAPLEKRKQSRVATRLRSLSEEYGLASREMSLVAVVRRAGDHPGDLPVTRVVPVGMPRGVNFGSYFPGAKPGLVLSAAMAPPPAPAPAQMARRIPELFARAQTLVPRDKLPRPQQPLLRRVTDSERPNPPVNTEDRLFDLVCQIDPDGGMPADTPSARAARSVAALYALVAHGQTATEGPFRSHVARLLKFLTSFRKLSAAELAMVAQAVLATTEGHVPSGDWLAIAMRAEVSWDQVSPN